MSPETFQKLAKQRLDELTNILVVKGAEYATDGDRLHNFNSAARIADESKARVLDGFVLKQYTNYRDMLNKFDRDEPVTVGMIREKFGDILTYFLIQEIIFLEKYDAGVAFDDHHELLMRDIEKHESSVKPAAAAAHRVRYAGTSEKLLALCKEYLDNTSCAGSAYRDDLFYDLINRFENNMSIEGDRATFMSPTLGEPYINVDETRLVNTPMHELYNTVKAKRDNIDPKKNGTSYSRWNDMLRMVGEQLNPEKDAIVAAYNAGRTDRDSLRISGNIYFNTTYKPVTEK